jgi:hypothetical protein
LRQSGSSNFGLIEDFHDGQLTTIASENQSVDDIGTFDSLSSANFDPHQGPLILFPAGSALSPSIGLYAATAASQYTLRFPQIADGGSASKGGWRTRFDIANRSTVAATATISFYDDNGAPINLSIAGQQQTQTMITVPALGVAQVQTDGGAQLKTGWALLQSDQNLSGIAIFSLLDDSGNLINEVGVPAALALRSMSVFTQAGSNTSTGVALANPNSSLTNVTLVLKDSASAELARTSMNISPMGHVARYAGELFPGVTLGNFEGRIDVFATQPVAAVTLRQRELVFTSLPIIP